MPKFQMQELVSELAVKTARLGSGTAQAWDDKEVGKAVKLAGDSRFDLCAAGDPIEGFVYAVHGETLDNYSIGSIQQYGRKEVLADGDQATPGTGTIAVGDYVVTGTVVAKGTSVANQRPKVCKATDQPGAAITVAADANDDSAEATAAFAKMANQLKNAKYAWRVVALLTASGTGAVGETLLVERVM